MISLPAACFAVGILVFGLLALEVVCFPRLAAAGDFRAWVVGIATGVGASIVYVVVRG